MNLTNEQIEAIHAGATREAENRRSAISAAIGELSTACARCWHREHAGCEHEKCSVWRMCRTYEQVNRMRTKGKLDAWSWYVEARYNDNVLFV